MTNIFLWLIFHCPHTHILCITPASSAPLGHCDDAVMTIGVQASEFLVSTLGHRPSCGTGGHLVFYI